MRRAFVIFLILLFPLNVFALSMSVSSIQQANAIEHVMASPADGDSEWSNGGGNGAGQPTPGDLDPDEPPSGMDFHDSVYREGQLPPALPTDGSVSSHVPLRHGLAPFPPIKPPPVR
jgi:hypothetical protein